MEELEPYENEVVTIVIQKLVVVQEALQPLGIRTITGATNIQGSEAHGRKTLAAFPRRAVRF